MNSYFSRFLICLVFVIPSWLAGAVQNMANGGDLLVTAGFAAVLAWALGLRSSPPVEAASRSLHRDS